MEETSGGGGIHALCDDALMQILARLPSKSVLRCRAVCKRWRRITADRCFLADHAARRPREMIVQSMFGGWDVEAVPLDVQERGHSGWRRRRFLCRYAPGRGDWHVVVDSLDGLLVLKQQRRGLFAVCNPTTRQWANLPELPEQSYVAVHECGFYLHAASGEYRLLCHAMDRHELEAPGPPRTSDKLPRYYHVLSAGATLPRRLGQAPFRRRGDARQEDAVAHRGVLHWIVHPQADPTAGKMLAFDTAAETFRLMSRPPEGRETTNTNTNTMMMALFEHDGELNAVAMHNLTSLNIWVLRERDYKAETWTFRHRVDHLPKPAFNSHRLSVTNLLYAGSGIIVIGARGSTEGRLYDLQEKRVISTDFVLYGGTAHVFTTFLAFNESLVPLPHAFFDTPRCPDLEHIYFSRQ